MTRYTISHTAKSPLVKTAASVGTHHHQICPGFFNRFQNRGGDIATLDEMGLDREAISCEADFHPYQIIGGGSDGRLMNVV